MSALEPVSFLSEFRAEAERRGFATTTLTETAAGPVLAFHRAGEGRRRYLSAGIHGDEPAGPLAALELLRSGYFEEGGAWTLCPALNPTGLAAGTRENAEGRDLNRDYLRMQAEETRVHVEWLKRQPVPELFISLHEDWETTGFYFYEINLGDDDPDRGGRIASAVAPWFPPEPETSIDDHDTRGPGWICHDDQADLPEEWPEAIFIARLGCPLSFTFETPSAAALPARIAAHVAAVRRAVT